MRLMPPPPPHRPRPEHREFAHQLIDVGLPFDTSDVPDNLVRALDRVLANLDHLDVHAIVNAHRAPDGDYRRDLGERLLAQWLAENDDTL